MNALLCIIFTLSGIYTFSILLQSEKASSIISVVPSGMYTVKFLIFLSTNPALYSITLLSLKTKCHLKFKAIYDIKTAITPPITIQKILYLNFIYTFLNISPLFLILPFVVNNTMA